MQSPCEIGLIGVTIFETERQSWVFSTLNPGVSMDKIKAERTMPHNTGTRASKKRSMLRIDLRFFFSGLDGCVLLNRRNDEFIYDANPF